MILKATVNEDINTRSKYTDVPGLVDFLDKLDGVNDESQENNKKSCNDNKDNNDNSSINEESAATSENGSSEGGTSDVGSNDNSKEQTDQKDQKKEEQRFFEAILCKIPKCPENYGIYALYDELTRISKNNHYAMYGIASIMLLRSLLEQSLKYYLRTKGEYSKLTKGIKDPTLNQLLNYYKSRVTTLFPSTDIQRLYNYLFESSGNKDFMDLVVHHTHLVQPTKLMLDSFVKCGILSFINYLISQ